MLLRMAVGEKAGVLTKSKEGVGVRCCPSQVPLTILNIFVIVLTHQGRLFQPGSERLSTETVEQFSEEENVHRGLIYPI